MGKVDAMEVWMRDLVLSFVRKNLVVEILKYYIKKYPEHNLYS